MKGVRAGLHVVAVLVALAATLPPAPSEAVGDIVYSARYYLPGSQPSHHHIWRINTDGSGRRAVTSGSFEDHFPVWLADRRTILFMRDSSETRWWCTVADSGGPVTRVADVPANAPWWWWTSPARDRIVYISSDDSPGDDGTGDGVDCGLVRLLDIRTRRIRPLGSGNEAAWSPDGRRLFISFGADCPDSNARVVDLMSGTMVALQPSLSAATWLDETTLVAEKPAPSNEADEVHSRLVVLRADGTRIKEVPLPVIDLGRGGAFADDLYAVPGHRDEIVYGWHSGDSTHGPSQRFLHVDLKTGLVVEVPGGRDLAWAPDGERFLTGDSRLMDQLEGVGHVWTSPLFVASLRDTSTTTIVGGLVQVGGFDWRP